MQNKAKRLLIPYVFVTIIWIAPISAYFFHWNLAYTAKKYLLAIDPSQLWFLWMLFGVFAIVWPLRKIIMEKPGTGWFIVLALYLVGILGKRTIPNVFCIWTALQYVLFFYIGMRIRVKQENNKKLVTDSFPWFVWIVVDLLLFVGNALVDIHAGTIWQAIGILTTCFLHVVGAIMAWSILQALAKKIQWDNSKLLKTLGSYSMPMYLFHQQIIYFCIVLLNGKVNPWINAGANFVSALIVSFIISAVLMRWKTTRFLIGEK